MRCWGWGCSGLPAGERCCFRTLREGTMTIKNRKACCCLGGSCFGVAFTCLQKDRDTRVGCNGGLWWIDGSL